EGGEPLEVFRSVVGGTLLDEVEIQDQVQGGDAHHHETEGDADQAVAENAGDLNAEETQEEAGDVDQRDASGGREDSGFEFIGRADYAAAVQQQHAATGA